MDEARAPAVEALRAEISGLEARVASLRLGRRVLMNLIELLEARRRDEVYRLKQEIARLKRQNLTLARLVWEKNRVIAQLQSGSLPKV